MSEAGSNMRVETKATSLNERRSGSEPIEPGWARSGEHGQMTRLDRTSRERITETHRQPAQAPGTSSLVTRRIPGGLVVVSGEDLARWHATGNQLAAGHAALTTLAVTVRDGGFLARSRDGRGL